MGKERGSGITPAWLVAMLKAEIDKMGLVELSQKTGVGTSILSRYHRGIGEPTTATLQKLADYFQETFIIEIKPRGKG